MVRHWERKAWIGVMLVVGTWGGVAEAAGWADGLFAERSHDFGPVPRGAKVRHQFMMTNTLGEPVTISSLRASCGCTSGQASASVVPPGQSATIEAQMDTRNFVGPKYTKLFVTLFTASGREAEVDLAVSSNILADIVLNPGTIDFGVVSRGQTARQTLTIDRLGSPLWQATRMLSASRVIDASLIETSRSAAGVQYSLTVQLKADATPGVLRAEILILTNDPESPSVPILVTGQVRGELTASPSLLAMGQLPSGGTAQARFMIRGAKPFAVTGVEGIGDGFTVATDDTTRKALHILTVSYRPEPGGLRGDLRRTFRILTDLAGEPPVEVTATLHVNP